MRFARSTRNAHNCTKALPICCPARGDRAVAATHARTFAHCMRASTAPGTAAAPWRMHTAARAARGGGVAALARHLASDRP
eukprot:362872-Chlamydomonas_euryale.AAC.4